ncbi:inclusion body family protein [Chitinophaga sp. HK235]|uniref:inclusion body family protein n=1 Tax=Chitinophaga sp. HK235 TaxID=2952571 RepID=UPI001BA8ED56|nr:inclusion body family protein [Chitinophaga sp. HK235]
MSNTAQAPNHSRTAQRSVANNISVLTIVDVEQIKSLNPNPSQDPEKPQPIHYNQGVTMRCPYDHFVAEPGPGNITFKANLQDSVSFRATTISGNSENAVIVYKIKANDSVNVFNPFLTNAITRTGSVVPSSPNGVPAATDSLTFYSFDSKIRNKGTESFTIYLALYELDEIGENQVLYGYFYWDPTIQVQ